MEINEEIATEFLRMVWRNLMENFREKIGTKKLRYGKRVCHSREDKLKLLILTRSQAIPNNFYHHGY